MLGHTGLKQEFFFKGLGVSCFRILFEENDPRVS